MQYAVFKSVKGSRHIEKSKWLKSPTATKDEILHYISKLIQRDNIIARQRIGSDLYDYSIVSRRLLFLNKLEVSTFPPDAPSGPRSVAPHLPQQERYFPLKAGFDLETGVRLERLAQAACLTDEQVVSDSYFIADINENGEFDWYSWSLDSGYTRCDHPFDRFAYMRYDVRRNPWPDSYEVSALLGEVWMNDDSPHILTFDKYGVWATVPLGSPVFNDERFVSSAGSIVWKRKLGSRKIVWVQIWRNYDLFAVERREAALRRQEQEEAALVNSPTVAGLEKELEVHIAPEAPAPAPVSITKPEPVKAPKPTAKRAAKATVTPPEIITEITEEDLNNVPEIEIG